MRKTILALSAAALLLVGIDAHAQSPKGEKRQAHGKEAMQGQLFGNLNLTPEQQKQVDEINRKFAQQRKELAQQRDKDMKGVLTSEQYQQLQSNRKAVAQQMKGRHGQRPSILTLSEQLKLTPEQQQKIGVIEAQYGQQRQALRGSGNPTDNREAMKSLSQKQRNEVLAVLTPGQAEQLKTMQKRPIKR